jgi:hypothetical protein
MTAIITIVSFFILIWTAALMSFGLKHSRNISLKNAAIAVVVPLAIYLVITYWNYLVILF